MFSYIAIESIFHVLYVRAAGWDDTNVWHEILRVNNSPGSADTTAITRKVALFWRGTALHFTRSHSLSTNDNLNIPFTFTAARWYYVFVSYKAENSIPKLSVYLNIYDPAGADALSTDPLDNTYVKTASAPPLDASNLQITVAGSQYTQGHRGF